MANPSSGGEPRRLRFLDLMAENDLTKSGLYKMLVEKPAAKVDGQPWSVLLGLYTFNFTGKHLNTLCRMGKIAREAAAPFLAGAPVDVPGRRQLAAPTEQIQHRIAALRVVPGRRVDVHLALAAEYAQDYS